MVNKVILIGRLGRDPEARKTNSGMAVAELRIATSRGRGDDEQTDWHTVVCFDKTADVVTKYLAKGRQVYVEGRLQHDSWEDKETGQKKYKTSIIANSVQFLGSRNDADGSAPSAMPSRKSNSSSRSFSESDVPF
tara:strand:+ start:1973 stop:2377 length:405 start_codon:yes stop_codon:yes gene_type:complete